MNIDTTTTSSTFGYYLWRRDDGTGGSGVREPRRPDTPATPGRAALPLEQECPA